MKIFRYLDEHGQLPAKGVPVIELGCGDGRVLAPFYGAGYSVTGVDKDPASVELARAAMPEGTFHVGDIRGFPVPRGAFVIMRNVLPFLDSKDQVSGLLELLKEHSLHFTIFGQNDELSGKSLWWTREEAEALCADLGAKLIQEFDGMSTNLAGKPRRSHIFYCLK